MQNSHPIAIPPGAIGLAPMSEERVAPIAEPIAPFATRAVEVSNLLPDIAWPQQIEVRAGKHMVRPRYEVLEQGRRRIAHVNVERGDLRPRMLGDAPAVERRSAREAVLAAEDEVVGDGELEHEAAHVAILGDVRQAGVGAVAHAQPGDVPLAEQHAPPLDRGEAGDGLDDRSLRVLGVGEIALDGRSADLFGDHGGLVDEPIEDRDRGAFGGER